MHRVCTSSYSWSLCFHRAWPEGSFGPGRAYDADNQSHHWCIRWAWFYLVQPTKHVLYLAFLVQLFEGGWKTNHIQLCVQIYIIKNELFMTFVSFKIIVYPAILCVNLLYRFKFWGGGPPASALQDQRYMSFELSFRM
jgi:hypothetical protein